MRIGLMVVVMLAGLVVPRVMSWYADKASATAAAEAREESARTARGAGPQNETPNEQLGRKLSAYAEPCVNRLGDQIDRASEIYSRWANTETLSAESTRPGTVQRISSIQECETAARNAATLTPPLPDVELAATVYLAAARDLDTVLGRAEEYYRERNYEDDAFALGNQLHTELRAKFEAMNTARVAFRRTIDVHGDQQIEMRLAELERLPGRRLELLVTRVSRDAEKLLDLTDQSDIDESGKLTGIDAAVLEQKVLAFEAAVDELSTYFNTHVPERASVQNAQSYINTLNNYLVPEAKALSRRVKNGTAFTDSELRLNPLGDGNVEGSPGRMVRRYNQTIGAFNTLRYEVVTNEDVAAGRH